MIQPRHLKQIRHSVGILNLPSRVTDTIPMPAGEDPAYATRACPGSIDKIGVLQARLAAGLPLFLEDDCHQLDARFLLARRNDLIGEIDSHSDSVTEDE